MPSNKPAVVQRQVIGRRLMGEPKARIAQELGIAKNTVTQILNDSEVETRIKEAHSVILDSSPDMARTVVSKAKKDAVFGLGILRSIGVIGAEPKGNENQNNGNALQVIFNGSSVYQPDNSDKKVITVSPSTAPSTESPSDTSPDTSPSRS